MTRRAGKIEMTIDEIVATLKHSQLPTIILEGKDDLIVFRYMEQAFSDLELSLLPVGGREKVLAVFDRLDEFPNSRRLAFIADLDVWAITGIPKGYQSTQLMFTSGYSIENDAYIDGSLEELMTPAEQAEFQEELKLFSQWYALALSRHISSSSESIKHHPNTILDNESFREKELALSEGELYPAALFEQVLQSYQSLIRGKSLIGLLVRRLSYKGRPVKHDSRCLLDVVGRSRGDNLNKFYEKVGLLFRAAPALV